MPHNEASQASLVFSDVSVLLRTGRRSKWLLANVSGVAQPGRVLAVLGPSGSGKSTLLKALSGRLSRSKLRLGGTLLLPRDASLAYVAQDARFFANLTTRETLLLASQLRRSQDTPETALATDASLRRLGLSEQASTLVGGESGGHLVPGLSGGERRRLAIGCEALSEPPSSSQSHRFVFADEATSGLDSHHAVRVLSSLRSLATDEARRCAVVLVLHQPNSACFTMLDDILLLTPIEGRTAYFGPASGAVPWFEKTLGIVCAPGFNPADWMLDLVSLDTTSAEAEVASRERIARIARAWEAHTSAIAPPDTQHAQTDSTDSIHPIALAQPPRGFFARLSRGFRTFRLLLLRSLRVTTRDTWVNVTRAAASILLGCVLGGFNSGLGLGQRSIQRRAALLMQATINCSFLAMVKSLNAFPRERAVVRRELQNALGHGGYSVVSYFLSKLLVDAPLDAAFPALFGAVAAHLAGLAPGRSRLQLLGTLSLQGLAASSLGLSVSALAPSTETALAIGPLAMVLSIIFGDSAGVFAEIPKRLQPLANLSIVKWGFNGALCSEFASGLTFTNDDLELPMPLGKRGPAAAAARAAAAALCVPDGAAFLRKMHLPERGGVGRSARAQARAIGINLAVTLAALKVRDSGGEKAARWEAGLRAPRVGESDAAVGKNKTV